MTPQRPNILLITSDQQRTDTLACYGNPHAVSPHLDRLAEQGVVFDQAHTNCPVCMPARTSLLTGVHTPVHGCLENGFARRNDLPTYPDLLSAAGYTCVVAGKTHFGPIPDGFTIRHDTLGEKNSTNGIWPEHLKTLGYDLVREHITHDNPIPPGHYADAFIADRAMAGIDQAATQGGPWFCHCSLLSPHPPYDTPGEFASLFNDRPLPPVNYRLGETTNLPPQLRILLAHAGDNHYDDPLLRDVFHGQTLDHDALDRYRRLYYGMATYVDAQVGRLMAFLSERGWDRNTLVLFSSDHGHAGGDHGLHCKHSWYDCSWRVPLLMRWPGVLPAGQRDGFAMWTDLTATILAAAQVSAPFVQGFDLLTPLAEGGASPRRVAAACLLRSSALASTRWKYEFDHTTEHERLFDRLNDPKEQTDLAGAADHAPLCRQLRLVLLQWRAELIDLGHLQRRPMWSGKVGDRAKELVMQWRGSDADHRLGTAVSELDGWTPMAA